MLSNLFKCAECQSPIDVVLSSLTRVEERMRETEDRTADEITNPFHVLISWLSPLLSRFYESSQTQLKQTVGDFWPSVTAILPSLPLLPDSASNCPKKSKSKGERKGERSGKNCLPPRSGVTRMRGHIKCPKTLSAVRSPPASAPCMDMGEMVGVGKRIL